MNAPVKRADAEITAPAPKSDIGAFWRENEQNLREGLIVDLDTVAFDIKQAIDFYSRPFRDPGGDYALRWACVHLDHAVKAREILKQLEAERTDDGG
jgi:hypothetical protein